MFNEKRRDQRVKEDFKILCRIFTRMELEPSVLCLSDISKGGVCFLVDYAISPGDLLEITLRMPPFYKEKAELFGRVLSCDPHEKQFRIRAAFIDISSKTKVALENFLRQASMKENPPYGPAR